jgi:hypothetical protein
VSGISVTVGLRAALLLARGRVDGADLVTEGGPEEHRLRARQSFAALLLCLPIFLMVQELGRAAQGFSLLRELSGFLLSWLGYAVLSHRLAAEMGRGVLWPRFMALWNWCNLVQYLLLAAALVPQLLGAPTVVTQTVWLVAMGWALWLQWSATRLGLGLSGGRAALMVAVDMGLGVVVLRVIAV